MSITRSQLTLGTDPEVFAKSRIASYDSYSLIKPAYFALGGDVDIDLPHGKAYPDGAAVEFTVTPSTDPEEMADRIGDNLRALQAHLSDRGYKISLISNGEILKAEIDALPESFGKRASLQILGCAPDVRIYHWVSNINRPNPKEYTYRTLGCHIHIGIGPMISEWPFVQFVTAFLDSSLGTANVLLLKDDTAARMRNYLYGKSGTIRVKDSYQAIEYRTLPAQSVCCHRKAAKTFFGLAQEAAYLAHLAFERGGYGLMRELLGGSETLQKLQVSIDEFRGKACRELLNEFTARVTDVLGDETEKFSTLVKEVQTIQLPRNYEMSW